MLVTTGWGAQGDWYITPYGNGKYRLFIKLCKISLVKDLIDILQKEISYTPTFNSMIGYFIFCKNILFEILF